MCPAVLAVVSTAPPTISWRCPACRHPEHHCTERFRMNCNGKLADVWLLYRCGGCGATRNVTVVERTPVRKVPRGLLDAATTNDADAARAIARDVATLRRAGAPICRGDRYEVCRLADLDAIDPSAPLVVELRFPEPLLVRLDAVVADALGVSRRHVTDLLRRATLQVTPATPRLDKLRLWSHAELVVAPADP